MELSEALTKNMLENPLDWTARNEYFIKNSKIGVALWVANGWSFLDVYHRESTVCGNIPFLKRWGLWKTINALGAAQIKALQEKADEQARNIQPGGSTPAQAG